MGINDDKHGVPGHADRHAAMFRSDMACVGPIVGEDVLENAARFVEANPVDALIPGSFGVVPLELIVDNIYGFPVIVKQKILPDPRMLPMKG